MSDTTAIHETLAETRINLARMEVQVSQLMAGMAELTLANRNLQSEVASMRQIMSEAKGGWKAIMIVGGIASTLGGFVSWVVTHVPFSNH